MMNNDVVVPTKGCSIMISNKVNKAKIRREASKKVFDAFMKSGEEYSCAAAVYSSQRLFALSLAKELLAQGITLSKSNYVFAHAGQMADMFLYDAEKLVCEHFYPKKK